MRTLTRVVVVSFVLAPFVQAQDRGGYEEVLALYCAALPQAVVFEHNASVAWYSLVGLLRGVPKPSSFEPLDRFLSFFEKPNDRTALPSFVREALALCYLYAPGKRDPEKALRLIQEAIDAEGWHPRSNLLVTLACVHFSAGRVADAIRVLEDQVDTDRFEGSRSLLVRYCEALRPDLASCASVDALFGIAGVDLTALRKALDSFAALEATPERRSTTAYFRARPLERDALCEEAAIALLADVLRVLHDHLAA